MLCTQRKWCDFVVHTFTDLHIERLQWDPCRDTNARPRYLSARRVELRNYKRAPRILRAPYVHSISQLMRAPPNDTDRELLALPARLGGLGIVNPTKLSPSEHQASINISAPLRDLILEQNHGTPWMSPNSNQRQEGCPQTKSWQSNSICSNTESHNPKVASVCYGPGSREGRLKLAHYSAAGGIWSHPPQRCLQRCHCSQIWLATSTYPLHVCLWHQFLCGACPFEPNGRISHRTTQWGQRSYSKADVGSVPRCVHRTYLATNHRWCTLRCLSYYRGRSQAWCCC